MKSQNRIIELLSKDDVEGLQQFLATNPAALASDAEGYTPLHWAAQYGGVECVRFLVDAGLALDAEDSEGFTPAVVAAGNGHFAVLVELINSGAVQFRKADGFSALHAAASTGAADAVVLLLPLTTESLNERDSGGGGRAPIHWACQEGHDDVIKHLIDAGADVESVSDDQFRPLRIAVAEGHLMVVRLLVAAGADVTRQVKRADGGLAPSALHDAAAWQQHEICKFLLAEGAVPDAVDEDGQTPYDHALLALKPAKAGVMFSRV